jgi:hypothetical protein
MKNIFPKRIHVLLLVHALISSKLNDNYPFFLSFNKMRFNS